MIDWNDNAKAAAKAYDEWLSEPDNSLSDKPLEEFLQARLGEKKTVADAVAYPHFKATRENLEKIAKDAHGDFVEVEQEGEKWTHTYNELKCRTLIHEPDREGYIVIVNELNEYYCIDDEELKPIKPTMTVQDEAVLVEFMKSSHKLEVINEVRAYIRGHDII